MNEEHVKVLKTLVELADEKPRVSGFGANIILRKCDFPIGKVKSILGDLKELNMIRKVPKQKIRGSTAPSIDRFEISLKGRQYLKGSQMPETVSASYVSSKVDYINQKLINDFSNKQNEFNYKKLIKMLNELNDNYHQRNQYACTQLIKALLHHIPPLFGYRSFKDATNHWSGWEPSQKKFAKDLLKFIEISDHGTHTIIGRYEDQTEIDTIPNSIAIRTILDIALNESDNHEPSRRDKIPETEIKDVNRVSNPSKLSSPAETTVQLDPLQVLALRLYAAMPTRKELIISRTSGGDTVHPMDTVNDSKLLEELNSLDVQEFEVNLDEMNSWGLVTVEYGSYNSKRFKLAKGGYSALKQLPASSSEKDR